MAGEGLHPEYFNWLLDTLYNQRGVAPFNPGIQQFPGNINEVTPNASNIPPQGTPSWQDLLGKNRYPFPANTNTDPAFLAAQEKYRTPARVIPIGEVGAYDSVKGVGDLRGRQLSPAEMYGEQTSDVPPWAQETPSAFPPRGQETPSVVGALGGVASRFLPPWAQAAIAAGRTLWPTSTAPPSRDEAPPWSWPGNQ